VINRKNQKADQSKPKELRGSDMSQKPVELAARVKQFEFSQSIMMSVMKCWILLYKF